MGKDNAYDWNMIHAVPADHDYLKLLQTCLDTGVEKTDRTAASIYFAADAGFF